LLQFLSDSSCVIAYFFGLFPDIALSQVSFIVTTDPTHLLIRFHYIWYYWETS